MHRQTIIEAALFEIGANWNSADDFNIIIVDSL